MEDGKGKSKELLQNAGGYALQSIGKSVEDGVGICRREEDVVEETK